MNLHNKLSKRDKRKQMNEEISQTHQSFNDNTSNMIEKILMRQIHKH